MAIQVGQKWRTENGVVLRVEGYDAVRRVWLLCADGDKLFIGYTEDGVPTADLPSFKLKELLTGPIGQDADLLASETLTALGWRFDGQRWVQPVGETDAPAVDEIAMHPLYSIFREAIEQSMYGKGKRHGGTASPFLKQPWVHYVKMHGRGFATGQAAKKLEEAASTRTEAAFDTEVLGAIVYAGMSILKNRGVV